MNWKTFLLAGMSIILAASLALSQTEWQKYGGNPVLVPTESWEASYGVIGPRVLKIGNQYKMWYTGLDFRRQMGLATSDDGIHWNKFNGNPVLRHGTPGSFDSEHAHYGAVLFINNQYWMWYGGHNGQAWQIGLATSPDGIQWTKHPNNPVLRIGSSGEWDSYGVPTAIVLFDGQVFRMWYNGNGPQYVQAAGYAESLDGIHWKKNPNNPVLTPVPGPWEANAIGINAVLYIDGVYQGWYGGNTDGTRSSIGLATSKDGVNWQRYAGNPLVTPGGNGAWDSITLGGYWVMHENDTYKMWYSGRGDDIWKIGYAVSDVMPPTGAQGRIVVSHDVNTLSSQYGGPQEQQFAVNVAKFLIGKNSGSILAIESDPLNTRRNYAPAVKDALAGAGYNVTYSDTAGYTLTQLMPYDAIYAGIIWPAYTGVDTAVLTDYVNSGGNVYIFSGAGSAPDFRRETALLNPFLKNFGLMFDSTGYNSISNRTITITSNHPIFDGVAVLRTDVGQSIIDLGADPRAQILQFEEAQGIYAVFDPNKPGDCIPLPAVKAYGNIRGGDQSHADNVTYCFPGQPGKQFLSFHVYDVDTPNEVKILLKGTKVFEPPLTANNSWSGFLGVLLPDGLIHDHGDNELIFDNTQNPPQNRTWGVRRVSVDPVFTLPSAKAYGRINGRDPAHADKVVYSFLGQPGNKFFSFQVYDIDTPDEVEILLNGTKIFEPPLTANNAWSGLVGVLLPDELIHDHGDNVLVFDNTKNPPQTRPWGVRQVSVDPFFTLPSVAAYGRIHGGDRAHADKVVYFFTGQAGDLSLSYEVYDIDNRDELDVVLNGAKIHDETTTTNNAWSASRTLSLPDILVNDAGLNVLIFDNSKNPPGTLSWGVRNVRVATTSSSSIAMNLPQNITTTGNLVQGSQYLFDGRITPPARPEDDNGALSVSNDDVVDGATTIAPRGHLIVDFQVVRQFDYLALYPEWNAQRYFTYHIEASLNGQDWKTLVNKSGGFVHGTQLKQLADTQARFLRIRGASFMAEVDSLPIAGSSEERYWQAHDELISSTDSTSLAIAELAIFQQQSLVNIADEPTALPTTYHLAQNFPNPFNPSTTIKFELPRSGKVELSIYNLRGALVRTIAKGDLPAGFYTYTFDMTGLASGIYLYRFQAGEFTVTRKMILAK